MENARNADLKENCMFIIGIKLNIIQKGIHL